MYSQLMLAIAGLFLEVAQSVRTVAVRWRPARLKFSFQSTEIFPIPLNPQILSHP